MGFIRLLLALAVLLGHADPKGPSIPLIRDLCGGQAALQTFFMISGFYMFLILNNKYSARNGGFALFYTNRLLKIYPVYLVVLMLSVVIHLKLHNYYTTYLKYLNPWSFAYVILANVTIIGQNLLNFVQVDMHNGWLIPSAKFYQNGEPYPWGFLFIPQAWSISFESRMWALYLVMFISLPLVFHLSKDSPGDRYLGELSYPLYIVHSLCLNLVTTLIVPKLHTNDSALIQRIFIACSVFASLGAALLLHHLIQRPLENYRQRRVASSLPLLEPLTDGPRPANLVS